MKQARSILLIVGIILSPAAWGQINPNCPGWKNPGSFNTGNPLFYWSARVGDRTYNPNVANDTTTGYHIMSTCTTAPDITGHANITSTAYNSGEDFSISSCNHTFFDANDSRFQIIGSSNAGIDQYTVAPGGTGMPRIPPGFSHSIRLGDMRSTGQAISTSSGYSTGNNKGAEALFYTMQVTPLNALLIINYAVVARRFSHTAYDAGEFLIRIVKQNADGSWPNAPINNNLWYKVSAPTFVGSEMPTGWLSGAGDVVNWPCTYAYKPWAKVAISLSEYVDQNVRVEMYTSDCIYNADPIYAYIAGDCQPMQILSAGCADANSDIIDTLAAPEGLISYTWYAAERGYEIEILNAAHMDTVPFRQISPATTSNLYLPTIDDFVLTQGPDAGDTIPTQTFLCKMTSALDPNKPIISKVYANVSNRKPLPRAHIVTDCDNNVSFSNWSTCFGNVDADSDSTRWIVYSDSLCSAVLDTLWGDSVSYHFPDEGYYKVEMRVKVFGASCSSKKTYLFRSLRRHPVPIILADTLVCDGERAKVWCGERCDMQKEWLIGDSLLRPDDFHPLDTVSWAPSLGVTTVQLTTYTDSLCPATTTATIKTLGNTQITSTIDSSILCLGDSAQLSAVGIDNPFWTSVPYDSVLGDSQGETVVTISPKTTTTYYVQPLRPTRCTQNAPPVTVTVLPYPEPLIWTRTPYVDLFHPALDIEDRSPHSNSSFWSFSDGQNDYGPRIKHTFATAEDSVWIALHACNNNRCCADTSITLPLKVFALWIPNTFTPDGIDNRTFAFTTTLEIIAFELYVYNRQGMLVYHGTDFNAGWDGTATDGSPCPQGAYVYYYTYTEALHPTLEHTGIGTVTLLR